jgi:predicted transport protein
MSHRKSIYKMQLTFKKGWNFVHITHQARIAMLYLYVANGQIETKTKDALSHKISIYQKCHRLQTNDGH